MVATALNVQGKKVLAEVLTATEKKTCLTNVDRCEYKLMNPSPVLLEQMVGDLSAEERIASLWFLSDETLDHVLKGEAGAADGLAVKHLSENYFVGIEKDKTPNRKNCLDCLKY